MVEGYLAGLTGYVSATCIRKIPYVFFLVSDFDSQTLQHTAKVKCVNMQVKTKWTMSLFMCIQLADFLVAYSSAAQFDRPFAGFPTNHFMTARSSLRTTEPARITEYQSFLAFFSWRIKISRQRFSMKHHADHMHRLDLPRLSRKKSWKSCVAGFEAFCLAPMIRVSWSRCGWLESLEGLDVVSLSLLGFVIVM